MSKADYLEWAADFVMATEVLRQEGYEWNKLAELLGMVSGEAARARYRRAKAAVERG